MHEGPELPTPHWVVVLAVLEPSADLPGVLVRRRLAFGVPLHAGRVLDPELLGQVANDLPRHVQRILQEPADVSHRADLQGQPQSVAVRAPQCDQVAVVVQEEEPLQLGPGRELIKVPYDAACSSVRNLRGHDA